jgi:hypothetical protein|tara:strand:- start:721 stop:912 length:192 start_codon:yes stop_codon:yes gene_type:complete
MNQLEQSIKVLANMTQRDVERINKKDAIKLYKIEQSVISAVDTTPWTLTEEEEVAPVPMALAI